MLDFKLNPDRLVKHNNFFLKKGSIDWNQYTAGKVGPGDLVNYLISQKMLVNVFDNSLLGSIIYKIEKRSEKKVSNYLSSQIKMYLSCESFIREKLFTGKIVPLLLESENKNAYAAFDGLDIDSGVNYDIRTTVSPLTEDIAKQYLTEIIHQYYVTYGDSQTLKTAEVVCKLFALNISDLSFFTDDLVENKNYNVYTVTLSPDKSTFIIYDNNGIWITSISMSYFEWKSYCEAYCNVFNSVDRNFVDFLKIQESKNKSDLEKLSAMTPKNSENTEEFNKLIFLAQVYGSGSHLLNEIRNLI